MPRERGQLPHKRPSPQTGFVAHGNTCDWVDIHVLGRPAPQGSKVPTGRGFAVMESNKKTKPWRTAIKSVCKDFMPKWWTPMDGPLTVIITCFFLPPKSAKLHSYPEFKSTYDVDKLARAVNDGLTEGGVIVDDARIVDLLVYKRYIWGADEERAEVRVIKKTPITQPSYFLP